MLGVVFGLNARELKVEAFLDLRILMRFTDNTAQSCVDFGANTALDSFNIRNLVCELDASQFVLRRLNLVYAKLFLLDARHFRLLQLRVLRRYGRHAKSHAAVVFELHGRVVASSQLVAKSFAFFGL